MRRTLTAALLCLPLLAGVAPAAQAVAPQPGAGQVSILQVPVHTINWDLRSGNVDNRRASYTQMIRSIHNIGPIISGNGGEGTVWETPRTNEVIAVNAQFTTNDGTRTLTLYLTADNLYLRGFSTGNAGVVVQFANEPDAPYDLGQALGRNAIRLPFNGRYGGNHSLEASQSTRQVSISHNNLVGAMNRLWGYASTGTTYNNFREDLVAAIAVVSEASRFRNIETRVRDGLGGNTQLNAQEAAEENDWGRGSGYMYRARNNNTTPSVRLGGIDLRSFAQGATYMSMLNSNMN
ncbi:ribosome-inactivating family protein [Kitasatospora sp. NPDC089913]|uniref:ribosome-inactivating family protein n=1 Tax=Streptomycetaceae TaxID=2062 RepID=UPI00087A74B5|nr:ribosome-inactivating family protein [Streptomyces sp. TLI_053]SDT78823.1 Ribosome inactivating protein [Streptomyces sp. TLI_053]